MILGTLNNQNTRNEVTKIYMISQAKVSYTFEIWIDTANKTEKPFSHIGRNDKYYRCMTI